MMISGWVYDAWMAEIADLRAANERLRETIAEWQKIHGTFSGDVHAACQVEIERLREQKELLASELGRKTAEIEMLKLVNQTFTGTFEALARVHAENERLRVWAEDEQAKRYKCEDQRTNERSENERLRAALYPSRSAEVAKLFHDTYESLAPAFGYETREETRQFDPTSPNGALMIAVVRRVLRSIRDHQEA